MLSVPEEIAFFCGGIAMTRNLMLMIAFLLSASQVTASAENMTVQSLLNDGYTVAGVITTKVGLPGVFLQNGHALVVCFVSETPDSATIATQYCKPVK
jgi:hypothetical protein